MQWVYNTCSSEGKQCGKGGSGVGCVRGGHRGTRRKSLPGRGPAHDQGHITSHQLREATEGGWRLRVLFKVDGAPGGLWGSLQLMQRFDWRGVRAEQRSRVQSAETHREGFGGLDRGGVRAPIHLRTWVSTLRCGCRVKNKEMMTLGLRLEQEGGEGGGCIEAGSRARPGVEEWDAWPTSWGAGAGKSRGPGNRVSSCPVTIPAVQLQSSFHGDTVPGSRPFSGILDSLEHPVNTVWSLPTWKKVLIMSSSFRGGPRVAWSLSMDEPQAKNLYLKENKGKKRERIRGTSLVVQQLRLFQPTQGSCVRSLVREDATRRGTATSAPQLLEPELLEPVPGSESPSRQRGAAPSPHLEKARAQQQGPGTAKDK